jgi:uncharacterized membrane protein
MFHVKQGVRFMELFLDCLWAFLVGGGICVVGQLLIDYTKLTPARILVSFVVLGVILYIPKPKSEKQLAADRAQIEKLNAEKQRLENLIK